MLLPSSRRCAACVASTSVRAVRFARAAPARARTGAAEAARMVPYHEASPVQRHQAMVWVRQILQAAYPFVGAEQWDQALEDLRLPLYPAVEGATLYYEGLTTLVQYLAACYPTTPAARPSVSTMSAPVEVEPPVEEPTIKQTYDIRVSLAEQLHCVSYWQRRPRRWFLDQALVQLLSQYEEALIPIPTT